MILSICIPTYNRVDNLVENIEKIIFEIKKYNLDKIKVHISNNSSLDDTQKVIEKYIKKYPNLISLTNQKFNVGPDANFFSALFLSDGDYKWLLGDDDIIEDGGLLYVYNNIINSSPDIIWLNHSKFFPKLNRNYTFCDRANSRTEDLVFNNKNRLGFVNVIST